MTEEIINPVIQSTDVKKWYVNGVLRQLKTWHVKGVLHRLDGPAWQCSNGGFMWYKNGLLHRLDGPAIQSADGKWQEWFVEGKHHRLDGPAVIRADGTQEWYVDGQRHRLDGPARINFDGSKAWYVKYYALKDCSFLLRSPCPWGLCAWLSRAPFLGFYVRPSTTTNPTGLIGLHRRTGHFLP